MNFLNPTLALAGLACVAVPIVIHLLMRRRRKPVMWAAMRFLMEAYRQQRRRLRLEQLLLLAARCLVIALVALAIGRPFLGQAAALGGRSAMTLYLVIDNGLASSAHEGNDAGALERHKQAALALLSQIDPAAGDQAALVALGGPAQPLVMPPTSDTGALRELVRTLEPTHSATDIPGGLALVAGDVGGQRAQSRIVVAVLSDFLTGSADVERALAPIARAGGDGATVPRGRESIVMLVSQPAGSGSDNITIAGVEPLRPVIIVPQRRGAETVGAPTTVQIDLRRSGPRTGEPAVTTVRMAIETDRGASTPSGQAVVRWAQGQTEATASVLLDPSRVPAAGLSAGASVVLSATIDPDAIAGDNVWRRPIEIRRALRVGIVAPRRLTSPAAGPRGLQQYEPADWVRLALAPVEDALRPGATETEIEITEVEPAGLDATRLAGLDAAVITRPDMVPEAAWPRLRAFAEAGGLIVVLPPHVGQVHLWPDSMLRDLGLVWSIGREAHQYEQGVALAIDRSAAAAQAGARRDLLYHLQSELPELGPPVRVQRLLSVEAPTGDDGGGVLMRTADGRPLVLASAPGAREARAEMAERSSRGLVVLVTTALTFEWTDLQARPLMVALFQELVRQGVGQAIGSRVELAGRMPRLPARTVEMRSVVAAGTAAVDARGPQIIRAQAGTDIAEEAVRHAGLWQAMDERGVVRGVLAVNADPAGGRSDAQASQAVREWLATAVPGGEVHWLDGLAPAGASSGSGTLQAIFDRRADDAILAFPLLLAALVLAVAELGMARWFSHATIQPPRGAAA